MMFVTLYFTYSKYGEVLLGGGFAHLPYPHFLLVLSCFGGGNSAWYFEGGKPQVATVMFKFAVIMLDVPGLLVSSQSYRKSSLTKARMSF